MSTADPWESISAAVWPPFQTRLQRYGFTVLAVAASTVLTFGLQRLRLPHVPFVLFYPTIVLVAMYAGSGPGILATILSAAASAYFFLEPTNSFLIRKPDDALATVLFAFIGAVLTCLTHSRRQARQALRVSEDELNRAQSVAHIGSWHYDIANANLRLSDEACRILGVSPAAVSLRNVWEMVHRDDRDRLNDAWTRALHAGDYDEKCRVLVAGQIKWVSVKATIELDTQKRAIRAVGTVQDMTERRQIQEALRESEDRYRDLVEHSEDLCCTHDLEGRLLSVNPAPARILGYTPEELLKIPMRELIIPEGRPLFDEYLGRLQNGSQLETGLLCVITRSGQWRTWAYRNTVRTEGVPKPIVRGMAHDITERRIAEIALEESRQREQGRVRELETILDTLPIPVSIACDAEFRIVKANRAGWKHFGLPAPGSEVLATLPEERPWRWLRQDGTDFLPDELPMRRAVATARSVRDVVTKLILQDGTVRYELGNAAPLRDEHGEIRGAVGAAIDITDLLRAEEALRESEERLWHAQEIAHIGTFDRNLRTGEARWTPQLELMFGLRPGAFPRTINNFLHLVHPDDRERVSEIVQTSMESGEAQGEWRIVWPDGTVRWITGHWKVFKDGDGQPVRVLGIDYDITERKLAEEMLRLNEQRFRVALKGSPTAIFSQDRELRYTWIYNFTTLTPEQVLGKTDDEIIGADKARHLRELKERVLKTGKGIREEVAISFKGSKLTYDFTIEPLFDTRGNLVGITGAATDIARLREMADSLAEQRDKLVQEKSYLEGQIETELGFEQIIGQTPALREVLKKVRIVAPTDSTVLLLGETGTGKELVARALHTLSSRSSKSFIKLNCASVPSGLLESELFGHEKGAFTGAVSQKLGRLELADGGTLFLDEVGELPLELQPKLLRVLQDHEFERLGGVKTVRIDVRIVSATNRDLKSDVAERNFREDLFYRLNVFPISLPPLRDRRSDIPVLVSHFVKKYGHRMGRHIEVVPGDTMRVLQDWNWPGNVRELENMIERMVILSKGDVLAAPPVELRMPQEDTHDNLVQMERDCIVLALRETKGVISGADGAARRLGLKRTTLQSMLKRHGIDPSDYRSGTDPLRPE